MNRRKFLTTATAAGLASLSGCGRGDHDFELLNVSYDPTRELYRKVNRMFAADYLEKHGKKVRVRQSHGGSGSQARSVIDGLPADVVTLAMWADVDSIRQKKLIASDWEERLPNRSLPYISTIVFVVRKGNPFGIKDWPDLVEKPGLKVITANPKTGGGAKLSLLGAWLAVLHGNGSPAEARDFITRLYRRVPVLDTGARGATVTFARKNIGDVHLTWENEAALEERELKGEVEIVRPSVSVRAEPHVAVVDENAARKGTAEAARAYLEFLYTPAAQDLIAELFFRPTTAAAAEKHADRFPRIELLRATDPKYKLGDWNKIQKDFFSEGGVFDQIYQSGG
jgi:sulfate/thiosulfate transport system substrate-binding protein